jgi:7-carboxy-7-deazaguanine synthase
MSKIDPNKLLISSDFYTVQGEGISSGIPSYFVRLGICNLTCGMSRAFTNNLMKEQSLEDGEIFEGDLVREGKATWTCDSTSQWLWRGEDKEFQYLLDRFKEEGVYDDILDGNVHIIWTGGEPTIAGHQVAINNFTEYWMDVEGSLRSTYYEIETNGTNFIEEELFQNLDQINCSPKLDNSGMTAKQRIVPKAIERIMEHRNYQFKFVISTEEDVKEIFRDFVVPFNIPLKHVVAMPGMDSRDDFHERTQFCLEMAKKYRFRGMTRLHLSAWDKTLNV